MLRVHGTCIVIDGAGVLLRGPSGAGKSDLALRLIDQGAGLVADDQVELTREGDALVAQAPVSIAGLMEVRGMGLFRFTHQSAPLVLVVDLVTGRAVERMPDPSWSELLGVRLTRLNLDPWEISAAAKVRLAARSAWETMSPPR